MTYHDVPPAPAGAAGEAAMKDWAEMLVEPARAEGVKSTGDDRLWAELVECQGVPVDLGGYYLPDPALAEAAMRPSVTFNDILEGFRSGG